MRTLTHLLPSGDPDFLVDFDKLRKGEVHPDNFLRGMSMAGVDKFLSPVELKVRSAGRRASLTTRCMLASWAAARAHIQGAVRTNYKQQGA